MAEGPLVVVHFKDLPISESVREAIEERCAQLGSEFAELAKVEVSISTDGAGFVAHAHGTGKGTDVATHASASAPGPAADRVIDKIGRQMRRVHDKRIFAQRRDAQKAPPKRRGTR